MQAVQEKKKITRPNKAKANAANATPTAVVQDKAAELVNNVVPVTTPTSVVNTTPTAATTATTTATTTVDTVATVTTPHVQTKTEKHKAIMIISPARIRRHLDKLNLNQGIDDKISELKVHTNAFKVASEQLETKKVKFTSVQVADGHKKIVAETRDATPEELAAAQKLVNEEGVHMPEYEMKISAYSRERTRFSNDAPAVLGFVCEELTKQLATHTMNQANILKKKIIQIAHLHEAGVESLSLYSLVSSLPAFKNMANKLANENKLASESSATAALLAQAEKDFVKRYSVVVPKKTKKVEAEAVAVVADAEVVNEAEVADDDSDDSKISFKFYVQQVCDHLKKCNPEFEKIRVSTNLKAYLSELLVEFIRRFAGLVLITATSMKNKTVNELAVMRTVKALLTDGHLAQEKLELVECELPDPEFAKAELVKREAAKLAGTEYKSESKAPLIKALACKRTINYPSCGYEALESIVNDKLKLYNASDDEESDEAVAQ